MFWFNLYSWLTGIGWSILDVLPQFIRIPIFKCLLAGLGRDTVIDYKTYIRYSGRVRIGAGSTINRGCRFFASHHRKDVTITIGDHVAIAPEVCFFAAGHDYSKKTLPDTAESIEVGDYAWIGGRSIVIQGVHIGEGAVIAAGSVVTRDIPPYTIAAGSPARVIKARVLQEEGS